MTTVVVVMGVAGSGKTTIGVALAARLGWSFVDADDHHPPENIRKMRSGVPLTDADRAPWLAELQRVIGAHRRREEDVVVAWSALRRAHRDQLASDIGALHFIHLDVSLEVAAARLRDRRDHFMPPELLASQLADLEVPDAGHVQVRIVGAARPVDAIVEEIVEEITATTDAPTTDAPTTDDVR